jgi:2',3'-cyclic-nucleotide 2'-phosphodiesterase (5'-nucleotidase family)
MVGILGFVDNWITEALSEEEIEFLDIFSTAKSLSADLKARGAQVVIALTHCGRQRVDEKLSTLDSPIFSLDLIYFRIENIDIVFGGHSRTQMETWKLSETAIGVRSAPWCTHLTKVL